MEQEIDATQNSSPETVIEPVREDAQTPQAPAPQAEKTVPYERFKEVNDQLKKLRENPQPQSQTLDLNELIAINASMEGLSQREKERLAEEHKLTGRPLPEIRKSEDFLLWQQGYHSKVEKERALKPSSTQPEAQAERKLSDVLKDPRVPREEKEELMRQHGLYKDPASKPPGLQRKVLMP